MTQTVVNEQDVTQQLFEKAMGKAKYILPFYILVPVLFAVAFHLSGTDMEWKAFGLGALGWAIALFLRGPLAAVLGRSNMQKEKVATIIGGSSGVFEESVRLAILLLTSMTYSWSLSIGQGWAAVEVVFTMINVIAITSLARRTDEKAMQAKEILKMNGNLGASPLWGVVERIFASALHIGFTLLVARYPWAVILFILLHSFTNLAAVKLMKKSVIKTELLIAGIGSLIFAIGMIAQ